MSKVLLLLISLSAIAQDSDEKGRSVNFFYDVLGYKGLLFIVGLIFFVYSYKNSVKLFAWIEDQTFGTRDYVLQKCELLFFEIKSEHVTYILLFISFGISILIMCTFFIFGKYTMGIFVAGLLTIVGWKIPRPFMDYLVAKRIKVYQTQMVDALNLLSNGLRAGLSVPQSLGMVVTELPKPVSQEFNLILQQTKIGVPLDEAFQNLSKRVPTEDNDMFVSSVNILRETGGNLAEVFDTIAEVIRERVRLQQKIDTYVAQGKVQGGLICSMPFLLGGYFITSDPNFAKLILDTIPGNLMIIASLGLTLFGGFLMWKVIQIKV